MPELEESRRLYNAQKRALREALAAAAEAEAVERQADEARARSAEAQVRGPRGAGPVWPEAEGRAKCRGAARHHPAPHSPHAPMSCGDALLAWVCE